MNVPGSRFSGTMSAGALVLMLFSSGAAMQLYGGEGTASEESLRFRESPVDFSARLTWRKGGRTSKAQLFVKGDRYRIEYLGGIKTGLGLAGVTIVRLDELKVWYLYSQRRLVLSVPLTKEDLLPFAIELEGEVERTLIGDAFVGQRSARLYEVVVQTSSGQREMYYEWVDMKHQMVLKLLSQDRDWWVEYEHVVVSQQPDYFFNPPLGYRKVEAQEVREEHS